MGYDVVVVGGGIVGLATASALLERRPALRLAVLEKEAELAQHQSGRNSGVVHTGVYYSPGGLKARFAREGARRTADLCRRHGIAHEVCGKVLLAVSPDDEGRLAALEARARENEVAAERLSRAALASREPDVRPGEALLVPGTGVTDFRQVALALATDVEGAGGSILRRGRLVGAEPVADGIQLTMADGPISARLLVNCAGLHSDRVARLAGVDPGVRIIPFRGEYYRLAGASAALVRHLVYPVPDPDLPFLGVHVHRGIDGVVHAGPNAVLAGRREGYRRFDVTPRDLGEVLGYGGFWRLMGRYGWRGAGELVRSLSRSTFLASVRRLVPAVARRDLVRARAGVRAQALRPDGGLVDDFLVVEGEASVHVVNAPSPAATSCLPIGDHVAELALERL